MQRYFGSCHCGAVRFEFTAPQITKGMRCDCSICARKGAVLSPEVIAPDQMTIRDPDHRLRVYQFGTGVARHHFCGVCGIHTFVETRLNPGQFRVNLGCVDGLDALDLPAPVYPGRGL